MQVEWKSLTMASEGRRNTNSLSSNQQTRRMTRTFCTNFQSQHDTPSTGSPPKFTLCFARPQGNKQASQRANTEGRARRPMHMRLTTQIKRAPPFWTHLLWEKRARNVSGTRKWLHPRQLEAQILSGRGDHRRTTWV